MCLIIAVQPSRGLPLATFQAAINSAVGKNPDGIGLAWPDEGETRILKRVSDYAPVIDHACALYGGTELPFFLHLRYSTVGSNTKANTHPFQINDAIAMAHNRTLDIEPPNHKWSDSRTVAELLKRLIQADSGFYGSSLFYSFIEHQAGMENRFVFLDSEQEELLIINDHLGVEVEGLWFSNLYAWDPGTVGIRPSRLRPSNTSTFNDNFSDQSFDGILDVDSNDVPLAWGSCGMDSRELEYAGRF